MADNTFNFDFDDMFAKMSKGEAVELSEELLESLAGGVLTEERKKELRDAARYFKGFWGPNRVDVLLAWQRDLGASEEVLAYCEEIWPSVD